MKAYGKWIERTIFFTSAPVGGKWSSSCPGRFTPGERALGIHWIGGWVDPRTGGDDVENREFSTLPLLEIRPLGRPARSRSLYRLRYPGCNVHGGINKLCRTQAEVILNHTNPNVRDIGQAKARQKTYKKLKHGCGQACDRSADSSFRIDA
jgi:hypothetical protein